MFKNKYSSFIVELAKHFLLWMELLVTKGLVFTDKILRYKVTSLDIYKPRNGGPKGGSYGN